MQTVTRVVDTEEPMLEGMVPIDPIIHKFTLSKRQEQEIRAVELPASYNAFGEIIFMRTYSRSIDGKKESFKDTIIRTVNGIMSIRKDYYIKHGIEWNDLYWNYFAVEMGKTMVKMHFLPPGRGLYICGTDFSYTRGGSAFNNCGFVSTESNFPDAAVWMFDSLMCGCGIGFDTKFQDNDQIHLPGCAECRFGTRGCCNCEILEYEVHDSRQGWDKSLSLLLNSYFVPGSKTVQFDYSKIRAKGEPLKGFGGVSSGSDPLKLLHHRIRNYFECYVNCKESSLRSEDARDEIFDHIIKMCQNEDYMDHVVEKLQSMKEYTSIVKTYGTTRLVVDILNAIGCCVVAGNVRRSSEIALGVYGDPEFLDLKNYEINPERECLGWMSNNTVSVEHDTASESISQISQRITTNGEPGILVRSNIQEHGRLHCQDRIGRENEPDDAIGLNPCSEIVLESKEYCNLAEVFISKVENFDEALTAVLMATFYASTVSLLETHWESSNAIIRKNRRIGVSITGIADFYDEHGKDCLIEWLDRLYPHVREENTRLAREAGVNESIRVTTVKPSGTISLIAGVSPGIHFPTYRHAIRTVRIAANSDLVPKLHEAGITSEPDFYSGPNTLVFSFPIYQGTTRSAQEVSLEEQAELQTILQGKWSDNSVSVTLYFNPTFEKDKLSDVISSLLPSVKSLSCLPHSDEGCYVQAPYQKISQEQYESMIAKIRPIQWHDIEDKDEAALPRGCDGDKCMLY